MSWFTGGAVGALLGLMARLPEGNDSKIQWSAISAGDAAAKINALRQWREKLLARNPQVFEAYASALADPDPAVWTLAAQTLVDAAEFDSRLNGVLAAWLTGADRQKTNFALGVLRDHDVVDDSIAAALVRSLSAHRWRKAEINLEPAMGYLRTALRNASDPQIAQWWTESTRRENQISA